MGRVPNSEFAERLVSLYPARMVTRPPVPATAATGGVRGASVSRGPAPGPSTQQGGPAATPAAMPPPSFHQEMF